MEGAPELSCGTGSESRPRPEEERHSPWDWLGGCGREEQVLEEMEASESSLGAVSGEGVDQSQEPRMSV